MERLKLAVRRLGVRLVAAIVALIIVPYIATLVLATYNLRRDFREKEAMRMAKDVGARAAGAMELVNSASAETKTLADAIAALVDGERLSAGGEALERALMEKIAGLMRLTAMKQDAYPQIQLIDPRGIELIRFELTPSGVHRAEEWELRDESASGYFSAAMERAGGNAYVHPLSLAREHGQVIVPHIPVIRVIRKIVRGDGSVFGLIVFNVNPAAVFRVNTGAPDPRFLVIDERGTYLWHGDRSLLWGEELGHHANFFNEATQLRANLGKTGQMTFYDDRLEEYRAWKKVFYDPADTGRYWVFLQRMPLAEIDAPINGFLLKGGGVLAVITLFSVLPLSMLIMRHLRPFDGLIHAMRRFAEGDMGSRAVPGQGALEFENVAVSFNSMADKIEASEASLKLMVDLEALLLEISTRFINIAPDNLDEEIRGALALITLFTKGDRAYYFIVKDGLPVKSVEWSLPGVRPDADIMPGLRVDDYPWLGPQVRSFIPVHIPDVDLLPDEAAFEKKLLSGRRVQSQLIIPVCHNGRLAGMIGFETVTAKTGWPPDTIRAFTIVSQAIVGATERVNTDIELADARRRFESLVQNMSDVIYRLSPEGKLLFVNQAVGPLTGHTPAEFMETHGLWESLPHPEDRQKYASFKYSILDESPVSEQYRIQAHGREVLYVQDDCFPVRNNDGKLVYYQGILRNITRISQLERLKEDFYQTIVHDLKSPITGMRLELESIKEKIEKSGTDENKWAVNRLDNTLDGLKQLYEMIMDLLHIGQIDEEKLTVSYESFNLKDVLDDLAKEFGDRLTRKKITFRIVNNVKDNVLCDKKLLRRVIQNIVDNAVKYCSPAGEILVEAAQTRKTAWNPELISISITNTGQVIEADRINGMFKKFRSGGAHDGSGIGLFFCQKTMLLLEGGIFADSENDRIVFHLFFPA